MAMSCVLAIPRSMGPQHILRMLAPVFPDCELFESDVRWEIHLQPKDRSRGYATLGALLNTEEICDDYGNNPEMPADFRRALGRLRFLHLTFSDYPLAACIVRKMVDRIDAAGDDLWLDNDYGEVISREELRARFAEDLTWDWRDWRRAIGESR